MAPMIKNNDRHYGLFSKSLHWLTASAMISLIAIGWYMVGLSNESIGYYRALDFHQVSGLGVLILFVVKIIWLWMSPNPQFVPTIARWQRYAAHTVHTLFIIAMVLIPISGYLFATSLGDPIPVYNVFEIPGVMTLSEPVSDWMINFHAYYAYTCAGLIVLHSLAALKHHFINRDDTLRRMTVG